jgi:hypothetical protein
MNVFPIILWSALGAAAIHLGIQGFRPAGMPFSKHKRLTGTSAKVVGTFCILFGLLCFAFLALIIIGRSMRAVS